MSGWGEQPCWGLWARWGWKSRLGKGSCRWDLGGKKGGKLVEQGDSSFWGFARECDQGWDAMSGKVFFLLGTTQRVLYLRTNVSLSGPDALWLFGISGSYPKTYFYTKDEKGGILI